MIKQRDFERNKKETLEKLDECIKEGLVDEKIIPVLKLINEKDEYYTSSSCYGRVVVLELPEIGDKKNAKWLGKWHHTVDIDDITNAIVKSKTGLLWILAQAPILHIHSRDLESADEMIKNAVSCGFKNSGFKSIKKNVIIEITSTERLDVPIGKDSKIFCDTNHMSLLIDIANDVLIRSQKKLEKFQESL